jgi:membrane fusion protein (multidrug efflux system)
LLCLPFVLLLYACAESGTAVLEESTGRDPVTVQTTTVQPGSWTHSFKSYGVVHPAEEYEIGVEVSANVEAVLFREGQSITAGDLLLRLDDRRLKLSADSAEAGVEEARAAQEQARSTHERNQSIFKTGVISEQAFRQSEADFKAAGANLRRAISVLEMAREELADAQVRSPVSGVVTRRDVEPGKSVSPMDRLGVIQVMDALRVETFVSQKDINHVRVGMPATVTSPGVPGQVFEGRVDQVASSAQETTGNFEVGVAVEQGSGLLRDGMSAMVTFRGAQQEDALAVPRAALVDRGRRLMVYRVEDGIARAVEPALGVGNAERVPVYAGLSAGDEVITSNLRLVSDGQPVQRRAAAPEG